ncbi:MAG TPA: ABC transporter ATP-binding protein [Candidatus Saccharimonadales bacterium]
MIELQNVTKRYGKKANIFVALDDVSLKIPEATTVAIIGKSGSGKSTMMHVMSGLDKATSGTITIGKRAFSELSQRQMDAFRSQQMSFIFQSFFVQGNESCFNNVSLPLEIANIPGSKRKAMVMKALNAVELGDKAKQRARDLSGGQKQRLAIARAIVNKPKILFADEPTGNLDSTTGDTIEKLLFDYAKDNKATLIVVTHDPDLAKKCDMQVHIKDGKIQKIDQKGKK